MAPGHAGNLILSSGNLCDRFLAFPRSSTFKPKRTSIVQNLVLLKDNLIVFIETFKKPRKQKFQQKLPLQNAQMMSKNSCICYCFQLLRCDSNRRTNTYITAQII